MPRSPNRPHHRRPDPDALVVDTDAACRRLDISRNVLSKLVRSGRLTPIHLSERSVRFRVADLEALVQEVTS